MPRLLCIVLVALLAASACGGSDGDDRPSAIEWRPLWEGRRDSVPTEDQLRESGVDLCGEFLGEVRSARQELLPSPAEPLDGAVGDWVNAAESLGLDCPVDDDAELAERLDALVVLAGEIDGGLEAEAGA